MKGTRHSEEQIIAFLNPGFETKPARDVLIRSACTSGKVCSVFLGLSRLRGLKRQLSLARPSPIYFSLA